MVRPGSREAARQARIRELFLALCDAGPRRRRGLLEKECRWEPEIRAEVEALLERDGGPLFRRGGLGVEDEPGSPGLVDPDGEAVDVRDSAPTEVSAGSLRPAGAAGDPARLHRLPIPERLGHWHLTQVLSRDDLLDLVLAERTRTGEQAVLEIGRDALDDPVRRARVEAALAATRRLAGPGLPDVLEAGVAETLHGSRAFLARRPVPAEPLVEHAERAGLGLRGRLELLAAVAEAVQRAHGRGLLHRHLGPGRVLVGDDGAVLVSGWGACAGADAELELLERTAHAGEILGTLACLAPEQVRREAGAIDARSDVWALGALAHQLLLGRPPHDLRTATMEEVVARVGGEAVPGSGRAARGLGEDAAAVLAKALSLDPEERYPSAGELAAELRRLLDERPVDARRPGALEELVRLARRRRWLATGAAVALLALLAGLFATAGAWREAGRDAARRAAALDGLVDELRGRTLQAVGAGEDALALQVSQATVDATRAALGARDPRAAAALADLALVTLDAGHPEQAVSLAEPAHATLATRLGPTAPETVRALRTLAVSRWLTGDTDHALTELRALLALQEQTLGPDADAVAQTRALLASWGAEGR